MPPCDVHVQIIAAEMIEAPMRHLPNVLCLRRPEIMAGSCANCLPALARRSLLLSNPIHFNSKLSPRLNMKTFW